MRTVAVFACAIACGDAPAPAPTPAPAADDAPWKDSDAAFRAREGQPPHPRGRGFVIDDSYKDPAIVDALLHAYHERHPDITSLVELGRTHQGRAIWALKISDAAAASEDEPAVLLDGAHHAGELPTIESVLDVIDQLVSGYGDDARITAWVDGLEIWCVPIVNPDGVHRYVHESRVAARKNARDYDGNGFAAKREGVDINRNYPFAWGEGGSSSSPKNYRFHGDAPASEPETQAMMQLAKRELFAAAISFHVDGTDLYTPYLVSTRRDPEPDLAAEIGRALAAVAPEQPNGKRYDVRATPIAVAGSAPDWHLHEHGTLAFVVEGPYLMPAPDMLARTIADTRPIWHGLLDRVLDGPWIGGHLRDAKGEPVVAEVMLAEIRTFEGESWKSRARDGRFDRAVIGPGRYTLVVRADGHAPIERVIDVGEARVDVDVVLP